MAGRTLIARRALLMGATRAFARGPRYERFDPEHLPAPAVIRIPGAGGPGSPRFPCRRYAVEFAKAGFVAFIADSPVSRFNEWLTVALVAIDYARSQPGVSDGRVALVGFSQGGSVALVAASRRKEVNAVVAWAGNLPDDYYESINSLPPALLLHGDRDPVIPLSDARQVIQLCNLRALPCELAVMKDEGHGFSGRREREAIERTIAFLRAHVEPR